MRFRLLRRRLTVSAPRMAVRSALPWPFRWAMLAVVFGFCAAIALWAFEFGKVIAGVHSDVQDEVVSLRADLVNIQRERDEARVVANTSQTLITAGQAAQEQLLAHNKQLEQEILGLRDDLGFFEKLIPMDGAEGIAVRGLQAEVGVDKRLKWRVLLIQPQKAAAEFQGEIELKLVGLLAGKPWQMAAGDKAPRRASSRVSAASRALWSCRHRWWSRVFRSGYWKVARFGRRSPPIFDAARQTRRLSMFNKRKQPPIKSLIAHGSHIAGNFMFTDGLRIDGALVGDIRADEDRPSILVVSETATITGAIYADHIIVNGHVNGPVHAHVMLELQPKARIEGDVHYRALEMHQGATITGTDASDGRRRG